MRMARSAPLFPVRYDRYQWNPVTRFSGSVCRNLRCREMGKDVDVQSGHFCWRLVIPTVYQLECVIFRFHLAIRTSELFAVRKFWPRHDPKWVVVRCFDCCRFNIAVKESRSAVWANQHPLSHVTLPNFIRLDA
jgi:hypothetical protein